MRDRMLRTKQSHDLPNGRMSSCLLHRTWTICTRAQEYRHKRWCEFMATFSSPAARAANFQKGVGSVHTNRPRHARFMLKLGD